MVNRVQNYAWGSTEMLSRLTNNPPSAEPQAEVWMGSHPKSPSSVRLPGNVEVSLDDYIVENPEMSIGERAISLNPPEEKRPGLPYLFKILTAERGLSIQAHPSRGQAQIGYEREDVAGIPVDAPNRTYRDRNHKPEMLYAVEDFWGMRGFRPLDELVNEVSGWRQCVPDELTPLHNAFSSFIDHADWARWKTVVQCLIESGEKDTDRKLLSRSAVEYAVKNCRSQDRDDRYWWVGELTRQFPGDPGAAAPLYLNLVHLSPGEAMYLDARTLHAYLYGAGVEIMANSDNVLRSGCTVKYVDAAELLRVLEFTGGPAEIISGTPVAGGRHFSPPAAEFELCVLSDKSRVYSANAPIVILALGGAVGLGGAADFHIRSGESVFVTAATSDELVVSPEDGARAFVASIPNGVVLK